MAEDARAECRAGKANTGTYVLNQRVDRNTPFIAKTIWQANGGEFQSGVMRRFMPGSTFRAPPILTAFVTDRPCRRCVGDQADVLAARGKGSRKNPEPTGCLTTCGTARASSKRRLASLSSTSLLLIGCSIFAKSHNVKKIAFDRWGMKYLKPWLLAAGFTEERIAEIFVEFGQGFQSMSPALRDLESALLARRFVTEIIPC
jgi:hypothetical protein